MSKGKKSDAEKTRFDLLPPVALEQIGKIFTYGSTKYDDRNWEQGINYSRMYAAAFRHLNAFWDGEDNDQESGLPHLAHAATNLLMLMHYQEKGERYDLDDRPAVLKRHKDKLETGGMDDTTDSQFDKPTGLTDKEAREISDFILQQRKRKNKNT